jgi:hypothetical protein
MKSIKNKKRFEYDKLNKEDIDDIEDYLKDWDYKKYTWYANKRNFRLI